MAMIEVNHSVLRDVASAITTYCSAQDKEMREADAGINQMLKADWNGPDAQEFGRRWSDANSSDSTAFRFRESLSNFGEALTACADEYRSAQEDAYNAAAKLR